MSRHHNKLMSQFRLLLQRVSHLTLIDLTRIEFLQEIMKSLHDFFQCDRTDLHIQYGDKCFHCTLENRSIPSVTVSNLCPNTEENLFQVFLQNPPGIDPLLSSILTAIHTTPPPLISKNGSYWHNRSESSISHASRSVPKEKNIEIRKENLSWAVIPLQTPDGQIGLILFVFTKRKLGDEEKIELYEHVAQTIVTAVLNQFAQADLRERVKELTCLYNLMKLVDRPGVSLEEILQGLADLLPLAWQYPETAAARVFFDNHSYTSVSYSPGVSKQTADIIIEGEKHGELEVVYLKEKPELYEGPFLKEERNLLDALASQISLIIQRRQADEEKFRLNEQLRHADRLSTIGQLAAGVAHELNEPLSTILGFAQLTKKETGLSKSVIRDLDKIVNRALHAREIIKKLMLFARQTPLQKIPVNLNLVVEDSLSLLNSRFVENDIALIRQLSPTLPELMADPSQMQQVLVNLLVNAVQAMPNGGTLTVTTQAHENQLKLAVEDNGIGMNEEVKKLLFIPFFTTKSVNEGTGLGLPVVHGIITAHGGTIHVESAPGGGTRFEIVLPTVNKIVKKDASIHACIV